MDLKTIVDNIVHHVDAARAHLKTAIHGPRTPDEVKGVLAKLAAENPERLAWDTSVTDLLKLLDLDHSLEARKALAVELGYQGAPNGSAAMNTWLHGRVMEAVAKREIAP